MNSQGKVWLVGAGPGDPGLLTLRGREVLGQADVVLYDGLVDPAVLLWAAPEAEILFGGKHDRGRCVPQEEINALLLDRARKGLRVVRLKGGDPYLFGRGGEEAVLLAEQGIDFEVIPGVSSLYAAPSLAGIPLTHRAHTSSVTFVTGHEPPGTPGSRVDWAALARIQGTLVVAMGLRNLRAICAALVAGGRPPETPVAVVSRGATPRQITVSGTLATIAGEVDRAELPAPAVTVVGEVALLREKLAWLEHRPLFGSRVLLTQRPGLSAPLEGLLREQGAAVTSLPATRWVPHPDRAAMDRAVSDPARYDWILFSNPVAVDFFLERLIEVHGDLRALGPARLGAYGPRTAARLREWRLRPAAAAADHKTPLILDALGQAGGARPRRVLILRGAGATEPVPESLAALGAEVESIVAYAVEAETTPSAEAAARLLAPGVDWIVFASALAIEHFHERFNLPALARGFPAMRVALGSAAIRPALEALGLAPAAIAASERPESLLEAMLAAVDSSEPLAQCSSVPCPHPAPLA